MQSYYDNQLKLSVLFYNMHLFGSSLPGADFVMRHFYRSPLRYEEESRARIAARRINKLGIAPEGCDLVGLCELWDDSIAERIHAQTENTYPYWHRPVNSSRIKYVIGSGLTLLSKYPIRDPEFVPFKTQANIIEKNCQKGILKAIVDIDENFPVSVLLTHFQAGQRRKERKVRLGQLKEIGRVLEGIRNGDYQKSPIILMGDFNVIAEDENGTVREEYMDTTQILGLKDIYRAKYKSAIDQPGFTSDGRQNGLLNIFHRNTFKRNRLDYIFSNNYRRMGVEYCNVEEFRTHNPVGKGTKKVKRPIHQLSDHYAVRAGFIFAPNCPDNSRDSKYSRRNSAN